MQSEHGHSTDKLLKWALCLFAVSVFFSVTIVQGALFLALLLALYGKHRAGSLGGVLPALKGHPLFAPWMVYLGVCLLTALTAYYPAKGLGQVNSDLLKYVCLFTLILTVRREDLPRLSAGYISAASVSSVFAAWEALSPLLSGLPLARAGVLMNAVRYGEALAIALLLVIAKLLTPAEIPAGRERRLHILAAALIFCALLLTQTRGAWLGFTAGLAAMFAFASCARKRIAALAWVILLGTALAAAAFPSIRARFAAVGELARGRVSTAESNYGISVRLELWKLGWKMCQAHPVVGIGPDNVKKVFKKFHPEPFPEEGIYGTLNSIYVQQAAERGLLGLGALLFLFWSMFLFALGRFRRTGGPYALWALCALPAFYIVNLTEISFQHVHTSFAVFMAIAFAAASEKETV